ncbi:MAG TPA: hypothetical protein VFL83_12270 [Anaeromyxobacter sp.]|nr:hypothetical protein [Anaeromyxobacter sp.]
MRNHARLLAKQLLLAALLVGPLAAAAQTADLSVTIAALTDAPVLGRREPNAGRITPTQTKQHAVTIANAGPSTATGIEIAKPTIDARFTTPPPMPPDPLNPGSTLEYQGPIGIVDVSGCVLKAFVCAANDPSDQCVDPAGGQSVVDPNDDRSWPCTIDAIPDFGEAEVTFDVHWPGTPDDPGTEDVREDIPTACMNTETFTATVVTVTTTGTTDPTTGNNTASNTPLAGTQAFLKLGVTSDKGSGGPGTQFKVTGTIENLGPCTALDVVALDFDGASDTKMEYVEGTTAGCAGFPDDPTTPDDETILPENVNPLSDGCGVGDMAKGDVKTFSSDFRVGGMLDDELQRATIVNLNAYSFGFSYNIQGPIALNGRTFDPDETDNVKAIKVVSDQDVSSCSTGGVPGVLGLLLAAMPLLRRRRSR